MNIYFAGAIRGGRKDAKLYHNIIDYLSKKGRVLTEHVGNKNLSWTGEHGIADKHIFNRDLEWLKKADVVIAEVSIPSLGVGYELAIAEKLRIPTLCLYRKKGEYKLSAMINGNKYFTCQQYSNIQSAKKHIDTFIEILLR